jgi:hypothetical protein
MIRADVIVGVMDRRVLSLKVAGLGVVLGCACTTEPALPPGVPIPIGVPSTLPDAGSDVPTTFHAPPVTMPPQMPDPPPPPPPALPPSPTKLDAAAPAPDAPPPPDTRPPPLPSPPVAPDAGVPGSGIQVDASPNVTRPPRPSPGSWWKPRAGTTWDWQLFTPINPTYDVQVYDVDLFENTAETIADLHARGRKVICYVNLGAWENWRPDAERFPRHIIGAAYHGFPDENWLDIRAINFNVLLPIIRTRLDLAVAKGCDAVEPDNINGYDTNTHEPSGFPLTYMDQLIYNRLIAGEAHRRGLAIGLKNDLPQVEDLVDDFDFAVNEQCFEYDECEYLLPFIEADKPVFQAEYTLPLSSFCAQAREYGFSSIRKTGPLDAFREICQ